MTCGFSGLNSRHLNAGMDVQLHLINCIAWSHAQAAFKNSRGQINFEAAYWNVAKCLAQSMHLPVLEVVFHETLRYFFLQGYLEPAHQDILSCPCFTKAHTGDIYKRIARVVIIHMKLLKQQDFKRLAKLYYNRFKLVHPNIEWDKLCLKVCGLLIDRGWRTSIPSSLS